LLAVSNVRDCNVRAGCGGVCRIGYIVWGRCVIINTIVIMPVLYGCETWFVTFREELKLRVLENIVLRVMFGGKRKEG
jgi:hypothetical protein